MRVKAYERQQEDAVEKQLDLEAYLDFIDKKKIVEKNYDAFKAYFDIPLRGEKGYVGFHLQVQYRVWHKVRKDGGSDGRGVGFYFRNVTELMLFGVRGKNARTLAPGRRQVNLLATRKREHSRKPDEQYALIEACSAPPYLELFARGTRKGWRTWGNEADDGYRPTWKTYAHHSAAARMIAAE
jgi:hypothetical protein